MIRDAFTVKEDLAVLLQNKESQWVERTASESEIYDFIITLLINGEIDLEELIDAENSVQNLFMKTEIELLWKEYAINLEYEKTKDFFHNVIFIFSNLFVFSLKLIQKIINSNRLKQVLFFFNLVIVILFFNWLLSFFGLNNILLLGLLKMLKFLAIKFYSYFFYNWISLLYYFLNNFYGKYIGFKASESFLKNFYYTQPFHLQDSFSIFKLQSLKNITPLYPTHNPYYFVALHESDKFLFDLGSRSNKLNSFMDDEEKSIFFLFLVGFFILGLLISTSKRLTIKEFVMLPNAFKKRRLKVLILKFFKKIKLKNFKIK